MSIDDFRLPPFQDQSSADQLDAMIATVQQADQEGVLATLAADKAEVRREESIPARVNAIRNRLFLLDYLRSDEETGENDPKLKDAIRRFQTEAGLTVDGWVGPQTWGALQELVSFEAPLALDRWMPLDAINPALKRALALRLSVQSFLANRRSRKDEILHAALNDFVRVARVFNLGTLQPDYSRQTLAALFDQDAILKGLASIDPETVPPAEKSPVERFMIANAKIELWLNGYDVVPDGQTGNHRVKNGKTRFGLREHERKLHDALVAHWMDIGQSKKRAQKTADIINDNPNKLIPNLKELFLNLLFDEQKEDRETDGTDSDLLYNQLITLKPDQQKSVWQRVKSIGNSLWDGVKRAWRWFKALIKKGVKKAAQWTKNLARLAFRFAQRTFTTVHTITRAVIESFKFITPRRFPGSDPMQLIIERDGDFDYRVFVNQNADASKVRGLIETLVKQARIFGFGVRLLGLLIRAVIDTVKNTATWLTGWFGFIVALVKLFKQLKDLKLIMDESQAFLATA